MGNAHAKSPAFSDSYDGSTVCCKLYFTTRAPRMGSDCFSTTRRLRRACFNLHSRMGSDVFAVFLPHYARISIHTPRMGSDRPELISSAVSCISIHTPRMGSDIYGIHTAHSCENFNPHSPYGERHRRARHNLMQGPFQSTLPVWGATLSHLKLILLSSHFNPHSPYGERQASVDFLKYARVFQSTLPVWGATAQIHKKIFAIDKRLHILHKVQMAYLGLSPCLDQYLLRFAKKPARTPPKNSGSYPFAPL